MLHGHTKIELKNEKTGEIQIVEKDNMITNALQYFFDDISKPNAINDYNNLQLPMYDNCLGGIVLMSETQSEDLDNVGIPANDKITGYASNNVNSGSDTKRGSKNLTESKLLDNGYQYVWDFTTSQANGEIASLGLTHKLAGAAVKQVGCISNILTVLSINTTTELTKYIALNYTAFDAKTGILVCIKTIDSSTLEVKKYKFPVITAHIGIKDKLGTPYLISTNTINLTSSIDNKLTWIDSDDNYYYGIHLRNSQHDLQIYRINKANFQIDTSFSINITLDATSGNIYPIDIDNYSWKRCCLIRNGYLYIIEGSSYVNLKLNLNDSNDIILKKNLGLKTGGSHPVIFNNVIHYGKYFFTLDLSSYWERTSTSSTSQSYNFFPGEEDYANELFICLNKSGIGYTIVTTQNSTRIYTYFGIVYDYLATINNLDTPVTKTSEQSMKITYTITEE